MSEGAPTNTAGTAGGRYDRPMKNGKKDRENNRVRDVVRRRVERAVNEERLKMSRLPLHPTWRQEKMNLRPLQDVVEAGFPVTATIRPTDEVEAGRLFTAQRWLSDTSGRGEPAFPRWSDKPVVVRTRSGRVVLDGNHRVTRAMEDGDEVEVYDFDASTGLE